MPPDDAEAVDLLDLLHRHAITIEEAYYRFDDALKRFHRGEPIKEWSDHFGFSVFEATAYSHGAGLEDLVTLRYQGWPATCCYCHQALDYRHFNWRFVGGQFIPGHPPGQRADPDASRIDDGVIRLSHIRCVPTYD